MIGHCPNTRDLRKIAADEQPYVAIRQALCRQDLDEPLIAGCHVSREKRDTVSRASCGCLCCLAAGPKGKPLVAKPAREPRCFSNEVTAFVETDKGRRTA